MSLLSVENLEARHGLLKAVRGVSFSVEEGQVVALVGANGAGKTTLLRSLAGAHRLAGGRIALGDEDVSALSAHRRVRMGIALVPEGRRLFPEMTVEENLLTALASRREGDWSVDRVLDTFPMLVKRRKSRCANLSGGEQQAVAIGRALMTNPKIILLDEVSLGLSPLAVDQVYRSLEPLIAGGTTILLVEQDLTRALGVADKVLCMLEGQIVLAGSPAELTREQITNAYFGKREPGAHVK